MYQLSPREKRKKVFVVGRKQFHNVKWRKLPFFSSLCYSPLIRNELRLETRLLKFGILAPIFKPAKSYFSMQHGV